jgi:hypothetical protein
MPKRRSAAGSSEQMDGEGESQRGLSAPNRAGVTSEHFQLLRPGEWGGGGEVSEGRGWSRMQTKGLGDRKGVRPGSGLSGPFAQRKAARSRHRLTAFFE